MPAFYEELIDRHGAKLQPMVDLVLRISASAWADELYPSTSMEALGLSRHAFYQERMRDRSVWIEYVESAELFRVTFQEEHRGPASTVEVVSIDAKTWQRIAEWLRVAP
jgi:hypothetical protein